MNNKKISKRIVAFSTSILLVFFLGINKDYVKKDTIIRYSKGRIFVGSFEYIRSIVPKDGDILVVDQRDEKDPNYKIINSYKVVNPAVRKEIIDALLCYEEVNPSFWNRSEESMFNEWTIHNIMHDLNYQTYRSCDVDLNNSDEKVYSLKLKK